LKDEFRLLRDRLSNGDQVCDYQQDAQDDYGQIPFHTISFNRGSVNSL
jgi:hypothetical protein